jgi:hypothetical protein
VTTRERAYVGHNGVELLVALVAFIGLVGLVGGIGYSINGLTHAHADVAVPVALHVGPGSPVPAFDADQAPVAVEGLPPGSHVTADAEELTLHAWDSTLLEQLLGRADALVLGLGVAAGAYLLIPLLRSVQRGQPFAEGNAARVRGLAVVVLVVGIGGPFLARLGSGDVLSRIGQSGPDAVLSPAGIPSVLNVLLTAALLAVLAEAFRRGEQLAEDVDGLV